MALPHPNRNFAPNSLQMNSVHDLMIRERNTALLSDLILSDENRKLLDQLIKERRYASELVKLGLPCAGKVLLHGSSGCGKTASAKAIATALGKEIHILNLSNIVSSRIGETSQNLKKIFEKAELSRAVLFLDEFDQIAKARGNDDKDVGEMRRLVNTLIQLIDYFPDDALLICATNHVEIIDSALLRRFQMRLSFALPDDRTLDRYYDRLLGAFPADVTQIDRKYGISFAEAKDVALSQVKAQLIGIWEKRDSEAVVLTV